MIVTTTHTINGYEIEEYIGMVRGIVVRMPTILQGFTAGVKSIVGGKVGSFEKMCEDARKEAYGKNDWWSWKKRC